MLALLGHRLVVSRAPRNHAQPPPHHRASAGRIVPVVAVAGLTLATGCIGVHAAGVSVNATINVQVPIKSITLTLPSPSLTYGSCAGGSSTASAMGFPNGQCTTASYTVASSGNVTEAIDVNGGAAVPSDGGATGPSWALCFAACANGPVPGVDQYNNLTNGPGGEAALTTTPQCDTAFTSCATAAPGASVSETLIVRGPSSSTDTSPSFSTTVTYTAV
jgi:hypothetical protein